MTIFNKEAAMSIIDKHFNEHPDNELVFATVVGSHMYGLNTAHSDIDLIVCYSNPTEKVLSLTKPSNQDQAKVKNVDVKFYEIEKFIQTMVRPNYNFIEMIRSPLKVGWSNDASRLYKLSNKCLSTQIIPHFDCIIDNFTDKCEQDGYTNPKEVLNLIRQYLTGIILYDRCEVITDVFDLARMFDEEYQYPPNFYTITDLIDNLLIAKAEERDLTSYETDRLNWYLNNLKVQYDTSKVVTALPETIPVGINDTANQVLLSIRFNNLKKEWALCPQM